MKQPILALTLALASTLAQPAPNEYWKFELLHSFDGGPNGHYPLAGLVEVGKGSFWGTALAGEEDHGTVFKFSIAGGLTLMHAFNGNTASTPPRRCWWWATCCTAPPSWAARPTRAPSSGSRSRASSPC